MKQIGSGLSADDPARVAAKAVIVEDARRLHRRLWNGKAKDAQISIDRIRAVMHHFQGSTTLPPRASVAGQAYEGPGIGVPGGASWGCCR